MAAKWEKKYTKLEVLLVLGGKRWQINVDIGQVAPLFGKDPAPKCTFTTHFSAQSQHNSLSKHLTQFFNLIVCDYSIILALSFAEIWSTLQDLCEVGCHEAHRPLAGLP